VVPPQHFFPRDFHLCFPRFVRGDLRGVGSSLTFPGQMLFDLLAART
jgi:hypothetical protein